MTAEQIQSRWGTPVLPTIAPEDRAAFFAEAPEGTLAEFSVEVYLRLPNGNWRHLEELVTEGLAYLSYETWGHSTPEYMAKDLTSDYTVIRLLRLGYGN